MTRERVTGGGERYALNLSLALAEHPVMDRPAMAAAAGFDRVEMWWPFPRPEPSAGEVRLLRAALRASGSRLVCLNSDGGDHAAGDRGVLSDPRRRDRCRRGLAAAVDIAAATGCRLLNLPYGNRVPGIPEAEQHGTAFDNLVHAARHARTAGITVLLEPLNTVDNPGYLLTDIASASRLVERAHMAGAANVGILLDVYHANTMGEDVPEAFARHGPQIRHVQFADTPGRCAPGLGETDFARIWHTIDRSGYTGSVGLEFRPLPDLATALRAARRFVAERSHHTG